MADMQSILETEYSEDFDRIRKNMVCTSFYKYGPIKENYGHGLVEGIPTLELCIEAYKKDGNIEHLADGANYLMFEFMYPQHPNAHYKSTDSSGSVGIVGMSVRQLETMAKNSWYESGE